MLSPLLANVALHGLETHISLSFPRTKTVHGTVRWNWRPIVVRYADDFVVLHEDLAVVERAQAVAADWLKAMGLELKPEKARISHTLSRHEGGVGFDFLGFEVRQYRVGYHRSGRARLGFKTIIKPSKSSVKQHYARLAEVVGRHKTAPQEALIWHLNPKIRGWANYHSPAVAARIFRRLDHLLFIRLRRWANRRHPQKSHAWIDRRYWHPDKGRKWVFRGKEGRWLARHVDTPIKRHVKVRGQTSPYDGNWLYWATRLGRHPELATSKAALLRKQGGRCALCGLFFTNVEDLLELDHRVPLGNGGSIAIHNRQLLHGHCHQLKSSSDGSHSPRRKEAPVTEATN